MDTSSAPSSLNHPSMVTTPVSLISLAPTILDLTGIDRSGLHFQGNSIAALVNGSRVSDPELLSAEVDFTPLFSEYAIQKAHKKAFIREHYKIIRDDVSQEIEIYNLESDPLEKNNIAATQAERRETLTHVLEERIRRAGDQTRKAVYRQLSDEELETLWSLRYVDK